MAFMMTDKQIQEAKEALPVLKEMDLMCDDNSFLKDIRHQIRTLITNIEKCKLFDIWPCNYNYNLEYGCGMYQINHIPNQEKKTDFDPPIPLLEIAFPTGAFIFGDRYDTNYFNEFFKELREVEPDYVDVMNHSLYYKPEKAKEAWNHYKEVYEKYMKNNAERKRLFEIEQLKKKLKELEK